MAPKKYRSGSITKIKGAKKPTFEAYVFHDGKKKRKRFKNKGQARAFIDAHEPLIESQLESLNSVQMIDAANARKLLNDKFSLTDAVKHFNETFQKIQTISIPDGIDRFLKQKTDAGRSIRTIATYRNNLEKLKTINKQLHEVTPEDLESTFAADLDNSTIRNLIRDYKVFLRWSVNRGFSIDCPADKLERPSVDKTLAEVFQVHQAASLLYTSLKLYPYLTAEYAIGLFAGLRPSETARLKWKDVGDEVIHVSPEVAKKTRQQRFVQISENLNQWISMLRKDSERRICHGKKEIRQNARNTVLMVAEIVSWPSNVLRHTFASNHLQKHQNKGFTSLQLGHSSKDVLFDHYRNLVKKEDADNFWKINPENCSKFFPSRIQERIEEVPKSIIIND